MSQASCGFPAGWRRTHGIPPLCAFPTESMISYMSRDVEPKGKPVAIDRSAISASPTEPAFVAPPKGAPVYHGFVVLDDVSVEGFTFGAITDFEAEPCDVGDAFVVAPDGSRAGLVWKVSTTKYFEEV